MRLFELLNEDPFTVQDTKRKTLPAFATNTFRDPNYIDNGYFSSVYGHPDNPHDVVKGTKRFDAEDGYEVFIRALAADENMRDNIYMPRIRTARVITAPGGQKSTMVRLERLQKITTLSEREAHMLLVNLIGRDQAYEVRANRSADHNTWQGSLTAFLNAHSSGDAPWPGIEDEGWLEAYEWIRDLAKKEGWGMDLHHDNWMVRRTPYGPQLVIIDPLGFRSHRR